MANYKWIELNKPIRVEEVKKLLERFNNTYFFGLIQILLNDTEDNDFIFWLTYQVDYSFDFQVWLDKETNTKIYYHVNVGPILKDAVESFLGLYLHYKLRGSRFCFEE